MPMEFEATFEADTIGLNPVGWTEITENGTNNCEVKSTVGLNLQGTKCCMLEINDAGGACSIRKETVPSTTDLKLKVKVRFDSAYQHEGAAFVLDSYGGNVGVPAALWNFCHMKWQINAAENGLECYYSTAGLGWTRLPAGDLIFDITYNIEYRGSLAGYFTDVYINDAFIGRIPVFEQVEVLVYNNAVSLATYSNGVDTDSIRVHFDHVRYELTSYAAAGGFLFWDSFGLDLYFDEWLREWLKQFEIPPPLEAIIKPKIDLKTAAGWLALGALIGLGIYGVKKRLEKK